ncbi:unnamed protein product [Paramecium primaurelia]|uniref:Uncharacterized protein n=1 Tax=Paramecium primaurelia TaxID=5886 RepID=A0A8S1M9G3_PARPR|nr:unnamed protein product [Paramecium primaurelia]
MSYSTTLLMIVKNTLFNNFILPLLIAYLMDFIQSPNYQKIIPNPLLFLNFSPTTKESNILLMISHNPICLENNTLKVLKLNQEKEFNYQKDLNGLMKTGPSQEKINIIDDTAKDMTMVYFPQWKTHSKDKWKTERGFLTTVYPKPSEPQNYTDVYIEGFEVLGDFSRKFQKDELNPKDFKCTIKSTREPIPSISIRKYMQDSVYNKLFHQNSNPSDFTTNTRYPKIYNKSIRQEIFTIAKKVDQS